MNRSPRNRWILESHHPTAWAVWALLVVGACGCSFGKDSLVSKSITTCRELSRGGAAAMEQGEYEHAQSLLESAVESSPTDLDARRQLAEALWENGSRRQAIIHLETAVRLDPRHAPTLVRSGEMLLAEGVVQLASQRAEKAIKLDPTLASAWALRGRVARAEGNDRRALADLQESLQFDPNAYNVLVEVAEVQYGLGEPQRCLTTLHYALDLFPAGEQPQKALWLEGLAYGQLERHADAVASFCAARDRGSPPADLLFHLAQAERAAGHADEALGTLEQALATDSQHQPSRLMLAELQTTGDGVLRR